MLTPAMPGGATCSRTRPAIDSVCVLNQYDALLML